MYKLHNLFKEQADWKMKAFLVMLIIFAAVVTFFVITSSVVQEAWTKRDIKVFRKYFVDLKLRYRLENSKFKKAYDSVMKED